ncbi:MAG: helix-turn-helix transcriptional regulator [Paludibacteraceae bacterium]|nr:helix-turn-helix transcriptional regulator [Paludibacteraceae bacterium]
MLASEFFPHVFSAGELYHSGSDFFFVENPRFCIRPSEAAKIQHFGYMIVTRGSLRAEIDGNSFRLTAGTMMVILPRQLPVIYDCSDDLESVLLFFSQKIGDRVFSKSSYTIIRELQQCPMIQLGNFELAVLRNALELCKQTLLNPRTNEMTDVYPMILSVVFRLIAPDRLFRNMLEIPTDKREEKIMLRFSRLVEENYREHRGVKYYADLLSLTPKYLSTEVKSATGKTANWWINHYVVREAKQLLVETDMPVKDIAAFLHFDDQLLFGKFFTRQTGSSPTAYRRSHH